MKSAQNSSEFNSIDQRIGNKVDEFLNLIQQGEKPNLEDLRDKDADIADEVLEQLAFFEDLDFLYEEKNSPSNLTEIDDFKVLSEIGRGGMGVVYQATQISLDRRVALKVLPSAGALDSRQQDRFKNEARAAAQLQHPHIVPVYAVGESEGVHYYAMQYIEGISFHTLLKEVRQADSLNLEVTSSLKPASSSTSSGSTLSSNSIHRTYYRAVAELFRQATNALDYSHKKKVVHRDIKPANLLLENGNHLWVADFGLAYIQESPGLTRTGEIVGTFSYMSPEQTRGGSEGIDHRTDIYSLGISLYEMLTLKRPFEDKNKVELVSLIRNEPPARPRSIRSDIPLDLETIVLKAIEKDPKNRYQSMADFSEDLLAFLEYRPIQARRTSLAEKTWRWCKRNRAVSVLTSAIVVMAIALSITFWVVNTIGKAKDLAILSEAEAKIYESLSNSRSLRLDHGVGKQGTALSLLHHIPNKLNELTFDNDKFEKITLELRNELIAWYSQMTVSVDRRWRSDHLLEWKYFQSPDFKHAVLIHPNKGTLVYEAKTEKIKVKIKTKHRHPTRGCFSPSGKYLLIQFSLGGMVSPYGGPFEVWDWENQTNVLSSSERNTIKPENYKTNTEFKYFSLDERKFFSVLYKDKKYFLVRYSLDSKKEEFRREIPLNLRSLAINIQGNAVAFSTDRGYYYSHFPWDIPPQIRTALNRTRVCSLAWSPVKDVLAVGSVGFIEVIDTRQHSHYFVSKAHQTEVRGLAFNPSGELLASTSEDETTKIYNAYTGELEMALEGPSFRAISWDSNGERLGFAHTDTEIFDWRVLPSKVLHSIHHYSKTQGYSRIALSFKNPLFATCYPGSFIQLFNSNNNDLLSEIPFHLFSSIHFDQKTGDLYTLGQQGSFRWPLTLLKDDTWILGPPRPHFKNFKSYGVSRQLRPSSSYRSQNGKYLAARTSSGVAVHDFDSKEFFPHFDQSNTYGVSNEGIVAIVTQANNSNQRGRLTLKDLKRNPISPTVDCPYGLPSFSKSSKYLVVSGKKGLAVYNTHDLLKANKATNVLPIFTQDKSSDGVKVFSPAKFSNDESLLVDQFSGNEIRLFQVGTWKLLANIKVTKNGHLASLEFSADDKNLYLSATNSTVRVLDLDKLNSLLEKYNVEFNKYPSDSEVKPLAPINKLIVLKGFTKPFHMKDRTDDRTLKHYKFLIEKYPDDPWIHFNIGDLYSKRRDFEKALISLNRAIELNPVEPQGLYTRAYVLEKLGRFWEATWDIINVSRLKSQRFYVKRNMTYIDSFIKQGIQSSIQKLDQRETNN